MKFGVPFNALCVVNRENARRPLEVYRFLTRELRTLRVQFIPCVEPRSFRESAPRRGGPIVGSPQARPGQPDSIVTDWSVDPADWGEFLCAVWDEWRRRDYGRVFVNLFESAVAQFIGLPAQICTQAQYCGTAMVLEHDGDVYSCDHFVYPEHRLGNILRQHEADMPTSWVQTTFGCAKCDGLPRQCRECDHLNLCWGECPRNRLVRTPQGEPGLSYLCPGFRRFYSHIHEDLAVIARRVQGRSPQRRS
jgi:uncharacterized protein